MATSGHARGGGEERAFAAHLPDSGRLTLSPEESAHLVRVRRVGAGERVVLYDGCGTLRFARLLSADPRAAEVEVGEPAPDREPARALTLAVSPPETGRADLLVEGLAWLGARRWVPLTTARTPPGRADLVERRRGRFERLAREALKGCGRSRLLEVGRVVGLADALREAPPGAGPAVLLDPDPLAPTLLEVLARAPRGPEHPLLLVGPEGGFTAEEVGEARDLGAHVARLGSTALRVEQAALAAAAQALGLL